MTCVVPHRDCASPPAVPSVGRPGVSRHELLLLSASVLVLLSAGASFAAAASLRDGVNRLPVFDMQDIRFVRLTSGGEVLNAWVRAITQDNQGFIWLASDTGLYRYDGYVLKQYRHDPVDPNTVGSDEIKTVFKDRNGFLWIGTMTNGLDRFDPARGTLKHYRHETGVEGSLSANLINCVYQDSGGTLWIGTRGGLDRLDPGAGAFIHYRHDPRDPGSLTASNVVSLYEDRRGNLWVGTERGLNKLDRATGRVSRFLHDPLNPPSLWPTCGCLLWTVRKLRGVSANSIAVAK